jgi:hypothetical protein
MYNACGVFTDYIKVVLLLTCFFSCPLWLKNRTFTDMVILYYNRRLQRDLKKNNPEHACFVFSGSISWLHIIPLGKIELNSEV